MSEPFRIKVDGTCATPIERWKENALINARHPHIERKEAHLRTLAVVGGGPSVLEHLEELRSWPGDIWAINDTATWLTERGIRCTLFTVDANQLTADAENAILATVCDPSVVDHFEGRVRVFDVQEVNPDGLHGGSTSATRAPCVAFYMGYTRIVFFGCEGSFAGDAHHIYDSDMSDAQLIVRAGGDEYRTNLQFFLQSQELAQILIFDGVFEERSGGLLRAMKAHPDTWEVVAVSAVLKADLERNGPTGMFDQPYQSAA